MSRSRFAYPVLSCAAVKALETSVLDGEEAEWAAMKEAGESIAASALQDFEELGSVPDRIRVLALVGKGNNGGDAMVAGGEVLARYPRARVALLIANGSEKLSPLARRAFEQLENRVAVRTLNEGADEESVTRALDEISEGAGFDICFDGLLGISFTPPLRAPHAAVLSAINAYEKIRLRAAVDLPSGIGDESDANPFRADFTYSVGAPKRAAFEGLAPCGRVRYSDLGFFDSADTAAFEDEPQLLSGAITKDLCKLRPAGADKREFGHLFVVGGSAYMPGALLMAVRAAVQSGVGLVTAFAPSSITDSLAAQVPEAMWVPWPESSNGALSHRAMSLLLDRAHQASAVICGPGMGDDRNTEMIAQDIVRMVECPVVLDADALRAKVVEIALKRKSVWGPVVATPHMGEYMRISRLREPDYSADSLLNFCRSNGVTVVLKGPITRICDGRSFFYSCFGGPVLARGGSGDLLAGLIGGILAQGGADPAACIARGVVLHGQAAEMLARQSGQVAVRTTRILDYLPEVIRR